VRFSAWMRSPRLWSAASPRCVHLSLVSIISAFTCLSYMSTSHTSPPARASSSYHVSPLPLIPASLYAPGLSHSYAVSHVVVMILTHHVMFTQESAREHGAESRESMNAVWAPREHWRRLSLSLPPSVV
jgi:hypothetical protein